MWTNHLFLIPVREKLCKLIFLYSCLLSFLQSYPICPSFVALCLFVDLVVENKCSTRINALKKVVSVFISLLFLILVFPIEVKKPIALFRVLGFQCVNVVLFWVRSVSPQERRYSRERSYSRQSRERSYSHSPPPYNGSRSRSQSPARGPSRSRSRSQSPKRSLSRSPNHYPEEPNRARSPTPWTSQLGCRTLSVS